jgi:hypothetical protein
MSRSLKDFLRYALVILPVWLIESHLDAQEFEVNGHLTYTLFRNGQSEKTTAKDFKARVSNCASLYRSYDTARGYYIEVACDGETLYEVGSFPSTTKGVTTNRVSVLIEKRTLPRDDSSNINYLWLAYGSGCYFDAATNDMVDPLWMLDNPKREGLDSKVRAIWERKQSERVPTHVAYLGDGYWHTLTMKGEPLDAAMPSPYDKGFTNATYSVLKFTNFYNAFVPTEFTFTRFGVRPTDKNKAVIEKITETHALVSSITSLSQSTTLLPKFDGIVSVVDTRLKNSWRLDADLTYMVTNGNWRNPTQEKGSNQSTGRASVNSKN